MTQQIIEKLDLVKEEAPDSSELIVESISKYINEVKGACYRIDTGDLLKGLKLVEKSFSKEGSGDNIQNGVRFRFNKQIELMAYDGTINSRFIFGEIGSETFDCVHSPTNTESIVINGKEIERAVKILKTSTEKHSVIEYDPVRLTVNIYSGEIKLELTRVKSDAVFPASLSTLMDTKFQRKVFLNRAALLDLLKSNDSRYVEFKFGTSTIQASIDPQTFESVIKDQVVLKCHSGNAQDLGATQLIMPSDLG